MYRESSSSRQKHRLGSIFWGVLALVVGWAPFLYWWRTVILREELRVFAGVVVWLVMAIFIVTVATSLWIAHNQRLARRGKRGLATRFCTLEPVSDRLGRSLEMPDRDMLRSSARIVILATDDQKVYSIPDCGVSVR